ncbi:MAG: LPS-assembly protein LptD [Prevotellaceae bacterium]|nr:LPS-assembly protein LptD [Prevotellaceae bacterium]
MQDSVSLVQDSLHVIDTLKNDTSKILTDTIPSDTLSLKDKKDSNALEFPVDFSAADSIVMFGNGIVHLYKDGVVVYKEAQQKEIKADFISVQMDSSTMHATGVLDSIGELAGKPVFKDGGQEYEAKEINYNFKTQKGFIRGAKTQEGEGYIIADKTKKTADGYMNMKGGKYTTCDNHDHPHFYLQLTKGKVKPGGYVAAGPAYMVLEDVPLPLALPFGFFPFTSKYASGIIMPSYGDELTAGFFLKNGGYYFALNDYMDLALTGDIYTKGSWRLNLRSSYIKRYKFRGSIDIVYNNRVSGEKDMPNYRVSKDFQVRWQHSQDSKASQFSTFSASVDFKTSGYNKNEINYNYNQEQSQNEAASSINYSQRFPESPFSFSINAGIRQRMMDSTISLTLPNFTLNMSQIYPLKKKNRVGKEKFYEKLAISFNATFENSLPATKESRVLKSSFSKDWRNGIQYKPSVSLPLTLFKYINLTPSVSYSGKINFKKIEQDWNIAEQRIEYDTVSGFYHVYNFSAGVSASTKMYGFYSPLKKIKDALGIGDFRHVFTPSLSFNYRPDFGAPMWKMYKTYEKVIIDKTAHNMISRELVRYSPHEGAPGVGEQQSLSLSLDNNLEMKVKDKAASDTTDIPVYKTVSLIDNFRLSTGYNFAADSLNLNPISASIRIKLTKSFSLNLSTTFEPYMWGFNEAGNPVKINEFRWKHGKFPYFTGTGTNFSYTFNNNTFKKKNKKEKEEENIDNEENMEEYNSEDAFMTDEEKMKENPFADKKDDKEKKTQEKDLEGYQKPDIQWSLSVNYGITYGVTRDFDKQKMEYKRGLTAHNIMFNGYINPTPNWKVNFNASLQLIDKVKLTQLTLNLSRDLHCWHLTASVTPIGYNPSFMITIGANSSMLQDLKYDKRSDGQRTKWF